MPDPEAPTTATRARDTDRQHRGAAHQRALAAREIVDILTGAPGLQGPRLQIRWEHDVTALARPGTGGRQPSIARSFEIAATREVRDWLGEPDDYTFRGALLHVWEIPDGGDGIIAARLSGQDVQNHETVFGQIHGLFEICERRGLKPRFLIASMRNSGRHDYERRLDFSWIEGRVLAGQCSWVAFYKADRIGRNVLAQNLFYRFLQDNRTGLFLEELGREVDWSNESDVLMLNTLGNIGQFEGARIKARTHDAFRRRWVLTGRGWPGAKRVGFMRDAGGWVVVDVLQWPHIKFAHMEFANSGANGGTSIRNLRDVLEERGFRISRDKLRVLLHDRIYVDGEWTFSYEGVVYPGKTVELADAVPVDVYERNKRLLGVTRGTQRVNPIGHYLLNRVLVTHTRCRHLVDKNGKPPVLRASRDTYKHTKCPQPDCQGFAVSHPDLDALVIKTLLKLCESKDLQAEYEQRADRAVTGEYDDAGRVETLRNRFSILKQHSTFGVQAAI